MRRKLGDILVEAGALTDVQLTRALEQQRQAQPRPKLGELLVELRLVSEEAMLRALASSLHLPAIDLQSVTPEQEALELLSLQEAEKNLLLPLRIEEQGAKRRLVLVVADPTNVAIVDDIQFRIGMVVQLGLSTASKIRDALRRHYHWQADTIDLAVAPPADAPVEPVDSSPTQEEGIAKLEVFSGPERGRVIHLQAGRSYVVGSSQAVDFDFGDSQLQPRHFLLEATDSGVELRTAARNTTTTVNQVEVIEASLKTGDFVQAGDTILGVTLIAKRDS